MLNMNSSVVTQNNDVITFNFAGHDVRAIKSGVINKQPWFVERDVADVLGFSNSRSAYIHDVFDDDKQKLSYRACKQYLQARHNSNLRSLWGVNDFMAKALITKRGVFDLVLNSRIPQARRFKHWITHDVLPKIDRTGNYMTNPTSALKFGLNHLDQVDSNQLLLIMSNQVHRTVLANIAKDKHIARLNHEKHRMIPEYNYGRSLHDAKSNSDDNLTTFANTLKTKHLFNGGSIKFGRWLREYNGGFLIKRYGRSRNMPKSQYAKYFHVSIGTSPSGHKYHQTLINPDGQVFFTNLLVNLKNKHAGQAEPVTF